MNAPLDDPGIYALSLRELGRRLTDRGIELFSIGHGELQIAERVRMHLMDSGVRVRLVDGRLEIHFAATASQASHPASSPEQLFEHLRDVVGRAALARGYRERGARVSEARDPLDPSRLFDVLCVLEYALVLDDHDLDRLEGEVRWALALERAPAPH